MVAHKPDGEYLDIAPMRILSFDIECAVGPDTGFPDPEAARVPVLCVCFYLELGGGQPPQRIAYSLMPSDQPRCEDGSDIDVRHYPGGEVQMLGAVWHFMTCCLPRPCIVTGWNSTGFDAWYLWNRCKRLGVICRTARCWRRSTSGAPVGKSQQLLCGGSMTHRLRTMHALRLLRHGKNSTAPAALTACAAGSELLSSGGVLCAAQRERKMRGASRLGVKTPPISLLLLNG